MTELVAVILAVGGLTPLLTAIAQRPQWTGRARAIVAVLVSLIAGTVTYVTTEGLEVGSPSKLVTVLVGVILASATSYKTIWKPLGAAEALERATSPATPPDTVDPSAVPDFE